MKHLIYILTLFVFSVSCSSEDSNNITGKINNYDPNSSLKEVYLFKLTSQNFLPIDTAFIQENGVFKFSNKTIKKDLYTLGINQKNAVLVFVDDKKTQQNITINNQKRWSKNYTAEGNEVTNKINQFTKIVNERIALGSTFNTQMNATDFNDTVKQKALRQKFESSLDAINVKRNLFIEENISSPAIAVVFDQINPKTEMDLFKKVVNEGLAKSLPNSNFYKNSKAYITMFERQAAQAEKQKAEEERLANLLTVGSKAPELNFPGPNGQLVSLSSLKGKVVLIDFWASWCRPCRMENPRVVGLYNKYKSKGFDIYSFSLDKNKGKWLNAIQQDKLTWKNHASDLKGWNTAAIPLYGFRSIPFTVLIDKQGKVIDKNLRGPALENKLQSIFGY